MTTPDWPMLYRLEPHDYLSDQVCGHVCSYRYSGSLMPDLMCGLTKAQHKALKESA